MYRRIILSFSGLEKKQTRLKTGPRGLKALPFVSCHMKDKAKVIHFHVKSGGVQSVTSVQLTFEKCTPNFYFESGKVGIKTTIANL